MGGWMMENMVFCTYGTTDADDVLCKIKSLWSGVWVDGTLGKGGQGERAGQKGWSEEESEGEKKHQNFHIYIYHPWTTGNSYKT